jgi:hypothetical protein
MRRDSATSLVHRAAQPVGRARVVVEGRVLAHPLTEEVMETHYCDELQRRRAAGGSAIWFRGKRPPADDLRGGAPPVATDPRHGP